MMAASLVDSIRVDEPGPSITTQEIQELEQKIGAGLPPTMSWMLFKYNGGRPTPKTFEVRGHPERLFDIQLFYGVTGDVECETIGWNIREFPELVEKGLIPFARTDTGDQLLLDLHDGSVVFWDAMQEDPDQRCYRIADDHAAFLTDLRTEEYP